MKDLVTRDRNHPSVMFYSFCNEPGCNNNDKSAPTQPVKERGDKRRAGVLSLISSTRLHVLRAHMWGCIVRAGE